MRRHAGFTMVELLVVIAILGIMSATALPLYRTFQQRTYGSEAALMIKRILDAQIMHYLEKDKFFPDTGNVMEIYHDGTQKLNGAIDPNVIENTLNALKITIPVGHFLDFTITNIPPGKICMVTISSPQNSFPLFKNGDRFITGTVNNTGKIDIL